MKLVECDNPSLRPVAVAFVSLLVGQSCQPTPTPPTSPPAVVELTAPQPLTETPSTKPPSEPESEQRSPPPKPTATTRAEPLDENSCLPQSGMYRLKRDFPWFGKPGEASTREGLLVRGKVVQLKCMLNRWILVEWTPTGGKSSRGWIHLSKTSSGI